MLGVDNEKTFEVIVQFRKDDDYADVLKVYRKKNGLTQKELGEKLGVEERTICSWEKRHFEAAISYLAGVPVAV